MKTVYKESAQIMRMVVGILSIVLSVVIFFESCAAGVVEVIGDTGTTSGSAGIWSAIFILAAGIVAVAARKTTVGAAIALAFYLVAAIFSAANLSDNYGDLTVWMVFSLIFAVLTIVSLFLREKKQNDEVGKTKDDAREE